MTADGVKAVTVFVSDQERARAFYVDLLGFEVRADRPFGENRWLEVGLGSGSNLVLHLPFPGTTAGGSRGTILTCSDIDADVARLRAGGVEVDGPEEMPWGRQATFHDPDGNGYVLVG